MQENIEKIKEFLSQLLNLDVQMGQDKDSGDFVKFKLYKQKEEIPKYRIYFTEECLRWGKADEIVNRLKDKKIDNILKEAGNNNIVLVLSDDIQVISKEKYIEKYKNVTG